MRRTIRLFLFVVTLTAICLAGCGPAGKRRAVSGTVTFQGKPIDNGHISFLSTAEHPGPVAGALIRDGHFSIPAEMGLEPGTYRVSISYVKGVGERTPEQIAAGASTPGKELIPEEFNTKSWLTAEVKESGPNVFTWTIP
jgi:hypothetical protein